MAKGVNIDEKALERVAMSGALPLVNKRADEVQQRASGSAAGFTTVGRFYDRDEGVLRPGPRKSPVYGVKHADVDENPHALVYTANWAAMKFEHENNGLLKASR